MIRNKTVKKSLEEIGIKLYEFDFQLEREIYCYLCCIQITSWKTRKLNDALKFDFYIQWKQYICNKYKNYSREQLIEFSRYLNLKIRNIKSSREYINIFFPCIIAMVLTIFLEMIIDLKILDGMQLLMKLIYEIFLFLIFLPSMLVIIWDTFMPVKENNVDLNLLRDYKEIIDEMLSTKMN